MNIPSMQEPHPQIEIVPDSQYRGIVAALPEPLRSFALLARFDRPIGWWLLYWPCLFGLGLSGGMARHWPLALWMLLGAVAMRGAGCVYNDIIDRDLDRQIARTAVRPLASGAVSVRAAWVWLILLALIGLIVLLQLRGAAQIVALSSLLLVAAYPYMKRITWWPQAWLGLVFSWGALVGWVAVSGQAALAMWLVYAGSIAWVIGYDSIYALQDREDDALVGVRSSARAMGGHVRFGVGIFYALAVLLWAAAMWVVRPQALAVCALLPAALHLFWQVATLKTDDAGDPLTKFRSNRFAGFLVAMAMIVVGSTA
jgi:4-hydroxybenzoate polyprenyltransferase